MDHFFSVGWISFSALRLWGSYQNPGTLERMQEQACTDMRGVHMVEGAGHWVQQEQPEETSRLLLDFLASL